MRRNRLFFAVFLILSLVLAGVFANITPVRADRPAQSTG